MESRGLVKQPPYMELICMCMGFSALGYGFESDRELLRGFMEKILNALWD